MTILYPGSSATMQGRLQRRIDFASFDLAVNDEACALTDVETSFWRVVMSSARLALEFSYVKRMALYFVQ